MKVTDCIFHQLFRIGSALAYSRAAEPYSICGENIGSCFVIKFNANRHESICESLHFSNVFPQISIDCDCYSIFSGTSSVINEFIFITNVARFLDFPSHFL